MVEYFPMGCLKDRNERAISLTYLPLYDDDQFAAFARVNVRVSRRRGGKEKMRTYTFVRYYEERDQDLNTNHESAGITAENTFNGKTVFTLWYDTTLSNPEINIGKKDPKLVLRRLYSVYNLILKSPKLRQSEKDKGLCVIGGCLNTINNITFRQLITSKGRR